MDWSHTILRTVYAKTLERILKGILLSREAPIIKLFARAPKISGPNSCTPINNTVKIYVIIMRFKVIGEDERQKKCVFYNQES